MVSVSFLFHNKDLTCEDVAGRLAFRFPTIVMYLVAGDHRNLRSRKLLDGSQQCLTVSTDTNNTCVKHSSPSEGEPCLTYIPQVLIPKYQTGKACGFVSVFKLYKLPKNSRP
jgi:hypothetical protein